MSPAGVVEVGPRDGLQNEPARLTVADRVRMIELLADAGLTRIETGAFVSPEAVPQMADSGRVLAELRRRPGVRYAALVPNRHGLERALAAGVDEIAVFGSATETFSHRNINCSIAGSLERFRPVIAEAAAAGIPARGYVSCVLGCPYEGEVAPEAVLRISEALAEMGCHEISLGDTIGTGTPESVRAVFAPVVESLGADRLAGHFHDTRGNAADNIRAALELGLRVFDGSVGGLGGCPYAPGAPGNAATESVVAVLEAENLPTGIDPDRLAEAGRFVRSRLAAASEPISQNFTN